VAIGARSLAGSIGASEQPPTDRAQQGFAREAFVPLGPVEHAQSGVGAVSHGERDGQVERHHGRGRDVGEHLVPAHDRCPVGLVERILFVTVLLLSHGEFIVAWLGIKTAGGWVHWSKERYVHVNSDGSTVELTGRNVFNVFLANQGVSLLFAGAGWLIVDLGNRHAWLGVGAVVAGAVREELQRAFLQDRFERHFGPPAAGVIVLSTLFGLGHVLQGWDAVIATAVLGGVWASVYVSRRSIVVPLVGHACFNSLEIVRMLASR